MTATTQQTLRDAVARRLAEIAGWDADCIYEIKFMDRMHLAEDGQPVWFAFREDADTILSGPIAAHIASVEADRDAAHGNADDNYHRALAAEAEVARLTAERDGMERALKTIRDFPETYDSKGISWGQGYAFDRLKDIARSALREKDSP